MGRRHAALKWVARVAALNWSPHGLVNRSRISDNGVYYAEKIRYPVGRTDFKPG